jgi:NAD+ kinase
VDPRLDAFLVTPICPHKLYARSIVVPPDKTIHLHLNAEPQKAIVSADGRDASFLGAGDILFIRKSARTTNLIKIEGSDFYSKLRRKLHEKDG